jgi:hypothetical protein
MTASRYPSGDQLLDDAMQSTGLSDFGPGDFREVSTCCSRAWRVTPPSARRPTTR